MLLRSIGAGEAFVPAFSLNPVDTMGAGDAFFSLASTVFLNPNHWQWLVLWEMHMPVCRWRPLDIETSSTALQC